jgi:myo-inositol 2-dehydrogenase/D-chiro-inositol 1-dehydrogenase
VVGETGTAALADRGLVLVRSANQAGVRVPEDWRERFIAAYDVEFQEWIDAVTAGQGPTGPSAWDGYAAQVVCDAGVAALHSGDRIRIDLGDKPALYS